MGPRDRANRAPVTRARFSIVTIGLAGRSLVTESGFRQIRPSLQRTGSMHR